MNTTQKKRLFVDMDGTLAEWRKISLKIESDEDRSDVLKKMNDILLTPGYFATLKPYENVVEAVWKLSEKYEVFVVSCVINKNSEQNPETEKNEWLDHFAFFIDKNHRIFVPDGENKMNYIPGGIKKGDALLDDFTKNLTEAVQSGMIGIKLLNDVNEKKGSWAGPAVSKDYSAKDIAKGIESVMDENICVRHKSPQKMSPILTVSKDTDVDSIDFENDLFL